jgi:cell wall-associated NlpC family hydrolase
MQEKALGEAIPFDATLTELRRGDLVFWRGHVGIMRDAEILLHANGHHMLVAEEPLRGAAARILANAQAPLTSVRRITIT